jgi:hypothetical protein
MLVQLTNAVYSTKHAVEDLVSQEHFDLRYRPRISFPSAGGEEDATVTHGQGDDASICRRSQSRGHIALLAGEPCS